MNIIEKHSELIKSHFLFNEEFIILLSKKIRSLDIEVPYMNYYSDNMNTNNEKKNSYYFSKKTSLGEFSLFLKEEGDEKLTITLSIKQKNKKEISQFSTFNFKGGSEFNLISDSLKSDNLDIMYLSPSHNSYMPNNGLFTLTGFNKKYQFVISNEELYAVDNLNIKLNITIKDIYNNNKELLDLVSLNYDYTLDIDDIIAERNKIKDSINLCSLDILEKEMIKESSKNSAVPNSIFSTIKKMLKYKNKQ